MPPAGYPFTNPCPQENHLELGGEPTPEPYGSFIESLSALRLDLIQMLPADCMAEKTWSFFDSLLLETIFPFMLLGIILAVLAAKQQRGDDPAKAKKASKKQMGLFVRFILLILPTISRRVCQTFQCQSYDDGEMSLLVADLSISCNTHKTRMFQT